MNERNAHELLCRLRGVRGSPRSALPKVAFFLFLGVATLCGARRIGAEPLVPSPSAECSTRDGSTHAAPVGLDERNS